MAHSDQLVDYFRKTRTPPAGPGLVGTEVETFFVNDDGNAITFDQSQSIFKGLRQSGWDIVATKSGMITEIVKGGSKILYELGYPNLELSMAPFEPDRLIERTRDHLGELYRAAERAGAHPVFSPIFHHGDYLAVPDERDATWLKLDGKKSLSPLARISAVQFTFQTSLERSIEQLNRLLGSRDELLRSYPQDKVWREYIRTSNAGYLADRYGGPQEFCSIEHYCTELAKHALVSGSELVSFDQARLDTDEEITLFVRSVWWYFRLRRYDHNLCIEVRPLARRSDDKLQEQLDSVLSIVA